MSENNGIVDVLVVDDTPANLKLLTSILSANGYSVRAAPNGDLALRSVQVKLPDIVLLDIKMPGLNGFEVCEKLKADPKTEEIPVIFISAMDDISDKVKAFSVGGVDYVTKPFEPEEVLARVGTHSKLYRLQIILEEQNGQLKELIQKQKEQEHVLIEQSKMAAMGEMISAIAHQWRQPLNALAIYIQDISEAYRYNELNEGYIDDMVSKSMKQIKFMSKTIDDFRSFFTPDKMRENFALLDNVNRTISLLEAQLKAHNIKISAEGVNVKLYAYPSEFQQVMLNLINNSKDAILERQESISSFEGEIVIEIVEEGENVILSIRDNGGGIDEAIFSKLFDPYFTTKFPKNGTGIGLYMVKEIIERHYGGKVIPSNVESGAQFQIVIPKDSHAQ
jgi:two-component system, sensor histidine kinase and response regulator